MAIIQFMVDPEAAAKAASGERAGGGLLPAGQYVLRVEQAKGEAPKDPTGYPSLVCKCKIMWSFNGNNIGRMITRRFRMSPKAIPYFFLPFCAAAGVPVQQGPQGIQFDDQAVLGAMTKAECVHSPGDRRTFEDWGNDEPVPQQGAPVGMPAPAQQGFAQPVQAPQNGGAPPWAQPAPTTAAPAAFGQAPTAAPWGGPMQQPMQQPMQGAPTPNWAPPPVQPAPAQNPWGALPPRGQG